MNKTATTILKTVLCILLAVVIIVAGYVAYLFIDYHRIDDNQNLEIDNKISDGIMQVGNEYTITTYNVGFGAYDADFSFFMDGGTQSRADDKETVIKDIQGAGDTVKQLNPDIMMFQEVDIEATRSYKVDQYKLLQDMFPGYNSVKTIDYDSSYLFYPLTEPHGKSLSSLATFSRFTIDSALRRSLPIETGVSKFFDLDRCYSIHRIPLDNGKFLCIYNVHLSAYTSDGNTRNEQVKMLSEDMKKDYENGNYVICGGDFNNDFPGDSVTQFNENPVIYEWAKPFQTELLPEGFSICKTTNAPSCRLADKPYVAGESYVITLDGFIVSPNVTCNKAEIIENGFAYADHQPIAMSFTLNK